MIKPEWGSKHICAECGTRYYDMERSPVVCPSCDAPEKIVPAKSRRSAATRAAKAAKPEAAAEKKAETEEVVETDETAEDAATSDEDSEDEEDDSVLEDTAELGEDEEDMAEVVDGAAKEKESDS